MALQQQDLKVTVKIKSYYISNAGRRDFQLKWGWSWGSGSRLEYHKQGSYENRNIVIKTQCPVRQNQGTKASP